MLVRALRGQVASSASTTIRLPYAGGLGSVDASRPDIFFPERAHDAGIGWVPPRSGTKYYFASRTPSLRVRPHDSQSHARATDPAPRACPLIAGSSAR